MSMLKITLNGEPETLDGPVTVAELLRRAVPEKRRVAVEVNREIVPRSRHDTHQLKDGDQVEIVHAIGGG